MNSIINEARGILYFNQSFAGSCTGGNIVRQMQTGKFTDDFQHEYSYHVYRVLIG